MIPDGAIQVPMEHFICGIYFLCMDDEIVYVGQSVAIMSRLGSHAYYRQPSPGRQPILRDGTPRPITERMWNHAFYIKCDVHDLDELERKYILELEPRLNGRRRNGAMMCPAARQPPQVKPPTPPRVKPTTEQVPKPAPAKKLPRWGAVTAAQREATNRSIKNRRATKIGMYDALNKQHSNAS